MVCFVGKFSDELFYILTFKFFFLVSAPSSESWGDSQIKMWNSNGHPDIF